MSKIIRHKRFPLEKSLPCSLYYSTNQITAKKLIHIKKIKRKQIAIKRSFLFDYPNVKDKEALLREYKNQIRAIEERYTNQVLPQQHILVWIPRRRRSNSKGIKRILNTTPTTNPDR